jgi:hypothetical protein
MSLLSHGLAIGLGYALGRPQGRARLAQAGRQVADLSRRPEVVRLRERGKNVAAQRAQTVKHKLVARSKDPGDTTGPDDAGAPVARHKRGLLSPAWRPRFSRSPAAHFPPPTNAGQPPAVGGTTVVEDSQAAILGTADRSAMPSPEPPASSTDHR